MSEYSLHHHGWMIRDRIRTGAYARALEKLVEPASVVLDIGTGSGIFAMLAARFGARRVFAVEPGEAIELARELALANNVADRITFIQGLSTGIELPEPADLIVSDLHGVLPLHGAHIPSIVDARARHLAADGTLIPCQDTLWAGAAELADVYREHVSSWEEGPYGLTIANGRDYAANGWRRVSATADALLADPGRLAVFDYPSISDPNLKSSVSLSATRAGTLHGVVIWFDSELTDGVAFTNAPGAPETVYRQVLFPLSAPVNVVPGDEISLEFWASLIDENYIFRWDTRVADSSDPGKTKAAFRQSTLFSSPLPQESLARRRDSYAPTPNAEGEALAFVLAHADGHRTLGDLSDAVEKQFPELFSSPGEAHRFVTAMTQEHCR